MTAILLTFIVVTLVVVFVHRALGRPDADLVPVIRTIGTITILLVALSKSPETFDAVLPHIAGASESGPGG
ncbi:hypothetical protein ACPCG0_11510 [Propionibacteriaceae bacterium Y1923]